MKRRFWMITLASLAFANQVMAHGDSHKSVSRPSPQELAALQQLAKNAMLPMKPVARVGNGTVRSWLKRDAAGKPLSIGLTLSEVALSGLQRDMIKGAPVAQYHLALPKTAQFTGFSHITLDWNPFGHPPKNIYDKPHFDVHFYRMKASDLQKITLRGDDLSKAIKAPQSRFMPAGYILPPDTAVPMMGAHAVDTGAPELRGKPFAKTFIYGFYNGQMNFLEPMVTLDYLKTKPNFSSPVKLPAAYFSSGYYPTRYSISYNARKREYSISLDGLKYRAAGKPLRMAAKNSKSFA